MRIVILSFLLCFCIRSAAIGQKFNCTCTQSADRSCSAEISCPDGCSAFCGSQDACFVSCKRTAILGALTIKFDNEEGREIARVLSQKTKSRIEFTPSKRFAGARFTVTLNNDSIWNALEFLNKRGQVKVNGVSFQALKRLQQAKSKGV